MLTSVLPAGSLQRRMTLTVGVAAVTLAVTQFVLPGAPGTPGRGTPAAILFLGLVFGLLNALTAAGIVLIYRTQRIINFAQTALGIAGAEVVFQFLQLTDVPFLLAFPIGMLVAGLVGLAFDLIFVRRFFNAPRLVLTVVTIAVGGLLGALARNAVNALPFFPRFRTFDQTFNQSIREFLPFRGFDFRIGSLEYPFGFPEVLAIETSIIALALVAAFFRFTRAGVAVKALAENSERASLLGISVGTVSSTVWTLAALLSGLSVFLTGAVSSPAAAVGFAPGVLLPALAAATIGRFRSLPWAVFGAVLVSVVKQAITWSFRSDQALVDLGLFLIVAIGVLAQRRADRGRSEAGAGMSWQATEEQRPVPKELAGIPTVRWTRRALVVLGLLVVLGYPFLVDTRLIVLGAVIALSTILALSLVVLTGWAGQVSLGQWAFAAIGAVVAAALTEKVGLPFFISIPVAAAVNAGFAVLIGIPALRIRGLFLAVTTFTFAFAVNGVLFNERYFGWLLPDEVRRPTLFLFDFGDERSMYFLCLGALVLSVVVVYNLRRSRLGRVLIAARENETNLQSFGVNLVRTKLLAFAVSGGLAGFAGAIFAFQQRGLSGDSFGAARSVDLFLLTVVGGVSSAGGALLGSLYFSLTDYFFAGNLLIEFLRPTSVLLTLYALPGGLISVVTSVRDEVLRIIAQRRQIVVPSLFADYDPDALERRLIPLGELDVASGLAALPADERYALASELYAGSGQRVVDKLAPAKQTREQAALAAAAASAAEEQQRVPAAEVPR